MVDLNLRQFETIRTTVTLPANLLQWSQRFIDKGTVPSRNALIVAALEHFLIELEQKEIDQQFAAMADDEAYQELSLKMSEAFAESDWEALQLLEEGGE